MFRKLGMWFCLLTKRLYKKPTFLVIMALIPLLVFGYGSLTQEESGMLTIAMAREDDDPVAVQVMEELAADKSLILFKACESPEDAENLVLTGKADAAWILRKETEKKVYKFVANPSAWNAVVKVREGESTIPLTLAREKLSGVLFSHCSRAFYLTYIREEMPELAEVSDEKLLEQYNNYALNGKLFEFAYLDSAAPPEEAEEASYLLTPVRGLLAVVVVLCGLATAMYYIRDEKVGTFSWIPERRKAAVEFGCQMISVLNVSVVVLLSLWAVDMTVSMGREVLQLLLYAICVAAFSMTMRRILGSIRGLGILLPLLIVVMLVVCPVFFDLGALRTLQYLFPPTYYINAGYSNRYFQLMGVYTLALFGVYYLVGKVFRRK